MPSTGIQNEKGDEQPRPTATAPRDGEPSLDHLSTIVVCVFLPGTCFWILASGYVIPFWISTGCYLLYRLNRRPTPGFVLVFLKWLGDSWVWELFVRRCHVGSRTALRLRALAVLFLVGYFLSLFIFHAVYSAAEPIISLEEMRVVTGTLVDWDPQRWPRRGKTGLWIILRLADGQKETFYYPSGTLDFYSEMKGQELTIWVQPGRNRQHEIVRHLQHRDQVIFSYEIREQAFYELRMLLRYCLGISLLLLLSVWMINRQKTSMASREGAFVSAQPHPPADAPLSYTWDEGILTIQSRENRSRTDLIAGLGIFILWFLSYHIHVAAFGFLLPFMLFGVAVTL